MSSEISSETKPFGDMCKIKYDMNIVNTIVNKLFKLNSKGCNSAQLF